MQTIIKLKPGTRINGIQASLVAGLMMLQGLASNMEIPELVITAGSNGKHGERSLHYEGKALDIRSKALTAQQKRQLLVMMNGNAGEVYDFILEDEGLPNEHFHLEVDPDD